MNKDLVIKSDEIGNLIFDKNSIQVLNSFMKNLKVISKITNYAKKVEKKSNTLNKTQICQKINLKISECEFIKISFQNLNEIAWITNQILNNEKNVEDLFPNNKGKIFDGFKIKNYHIINNSFLKINNDIFSKTPRCLSIKKEFLLLPQIKWENNLSSEYSLWIVCSKNNKSKIVNIVEKLIKKYQIFKNQIVEVTFESLSIVSKPCKFNINQIAVPKNFKKEVNLINNFAKKFKFFIKEDVSTKRGILLYGPPGTGKTITLKCLADSFKKYGGSVFFCYNLVDRAYMNHTLSDIYKIAESCSPSMVILEDFDLLVASRQMDQIKTTGSQVSNELLKILEESKNNKNVITLASTNILEGIDEAAIRHGRIDRCYFFDYPDLKSKEKILKEHLKLYKIKLNFTDVKNVLQNILNSEVTGATIMSIVRSAVQYSISEQRNINLDDFMYCSKHIKTSNLNENIL